METIDDECLEHALGFIDQRNADGTPFFLWFNSTHMHFRTHPKPESVGPAAAGSPRTTTRLSTTTGWSGPCSTSSTSWASRTNTIVVYSTDNGPHMNTWPDGGMTPFRSEKNTNWEGAFRVPEMVRWPGKIAAGTVSNEIVQHHDWLPTFLARPARPTSSTT